MTEINLNEVDCKSEESLEKLNMVQLHNILRMKIDEGKKELKGLISQSEKGTKANIIKEIIKSEMNESTVESDSVPTDSLQVTKQPEEKADESTSAIG